MNQICTTQKYPQRFPLYLNPMAYKLKSVWPLLTFTISFSTTLLSHLATWLQLEWPSWYSLKHAILLQCLGLSISCSLNLENSYCRGSHYWPLSTCCLCSNALSSTKLFIMPMKFINSFIILVSVHSATIILYHFIIHDFHCCSYHYLKLYHLFIVAFYRRPLNSIRERSFICLIFP